MDCYACQLTQGQKDLPGGRVHRTRLPTLWERQQPPYAFLSGLLCLMPQSVGLFPAHDGQGIAILVNKLELTYPDPP